MRESYYVREIQKDEGIITELFHRFLIRFYRMKFYNGFFV